MRIVVHHGKEGFPFPDQQPFHAFALGYVPHIRQNVISLRQRQLGQKHLYVEFGPVLRPPGLPFEELVLTGHDLLPVGQRPVGQCLVLGIVRCRIVGNNVELDCFFAGYPVQLEHLVVNVYDFSVAIMDKDRIVDIVKDRSQIVLCCMKLLFHPFAFGNIPDVRQNEVPVGQGQPGEIDLYIEFGTVLRPLCLPLKELVLAGQHLFPYGRQPIHRITGGRVVANDVAVHCLFTGDPIHLEHLVVNVYDFSVHVVDMDCVVNMVENGPEIVFCCMKLLSHNTAFQYFMNDFGFFCHDPPHSPGLQAADRSYSG
ncbi:MAG: hypothetical protein A4E57_04060 [Syntrophorhabdaceae bacterium PtaU1.Bin034]|nr:MAG: hypothetical protein A4E57_04060 [Syntrophorhabdaceae bacterium PtaU1.Bin034]